MADNSDVKASCVWLAAGSDWADFGNDGGLGRGVAGSRVLNTGAEAQA